MIKYNMVTNDYNDKTEYGQIRANPQLDKLHIYTPMIGLSVINGFKCRRSLGSSYW